MVNVTEALIDSLLANSDSLFNNIYAFECTVSSMPGKSHRGLTITHQDLAERREDFIKELKFTINSWVYSRSQYNAIINQAMLDRGGDIQNAMAFMHELVRQKFRKGHPKGQFGELLLFNVIQHYFHAVPLLRKMSITTNPAIERHGADAIHYRLKGDKHLVYIGEAKTYGAKHKFSVAVRDAVDSILDSYGNFQTELGLYTYDEFIDGDLEDVARGIKNNTLDNVNYELVCVVSYEESKSKSRATEAEIKSAIQEVVVQRFKKFDVSHFGNRCPFLLGRLHLLAVPIWGLDDLMETFEK